MKSEVELTVIGPVEDAAYWEKCRHQIGRLDARIKVEYKGPRRHEELLPILQQHHLFILPTTGENFGHAIFEALLAGRPVLISDQTPWLGLAAKQIGWDLPLQDPAAFSRVLEEVCRWNQVEFDGWALSAWQYARHFIENPELQSQYLRLFA